MAWLGRAIDPTNPRDLNMLLQKGLLFLLAVSCAMKCQAGEDERFDVPKFAFHECRSLQSGVLYALFSRALCIRGTTDDALAKQVAVDLEYLSNMGYQIDYVVISGPGGEATPAMAIARNIASGRYDVVVGDTCASSCAQYLFPAGRRKYILKGGAVLPGSRLRDRGLPDVYEEERVDGR